VFMFVDLFGLSPALEHTTLSIPIKNPHLLFGLLEPSFFFFPLFRFVVDALFYDAPSFFECFIVTPFSS